MFPKSLTSSDPTVLCRPGLLALHRSQATYPVTETGTLPIIKYLLPEPVLQTTEVLSIVVPGIMGEVSRRYGFRVNLCQKTLGTALRRFIQSISSADPSGRAAVALILTQLVNASRLWQQ